jgi:hypothetical protein
MNLMIDINTILEGIAVVGIVGIFGQLWRLNGSVGQMRVWMEQHEKIDDERYKEIRQELQNYWQTLQAVHKEVQR